MALKGLQPLLSPPRHRCRKQQMEIKYKAPKAGKSLLAKVAAKSGSASGRGRGGLSKGSSSSFGSGGGVGGGVGGGAGGGSREEGTVKAPRVKGQGKGKLIHKTEPIEKEGNPCAGGFVTPLLAFQRGEQCRKCQDGVAAALATRNVPGLGGNWGVQSVT